MPDADAVAERPDHPEVYNGRGNAFQNLGRFDEAVASYDKAIALKPGYAQAYFNRGNALQGLRCFEEAIASYDVAIALKPDYAHAYGNRGNALKALNWFEDAITSYGKAIALKPDYAGAYNNRAIVLRRVNRLDEAIEDYEKAIALSPDRAELYSNRGNALQGLKRFDEAITCYDTAVALDPDYADASWNRALLHLLTGRFDIGWRGFEARKTKRGPIGNRIFARPSWLGDADISGKMILVHWEDGLGNDIQFCRYVRLLEAAGAKVLFAPQKALKTLMRGLDAKARIVDVDDPALLFDCHCPIMSLPLAFGTEVTTIPNASYLSADQEKIMSWERRLGERTRPRIGVVWSTTHDSTGRNVELQRFRRLFDRRFEFISLQKEMLDRDQASWDPADIVHYGDAIEDFSDTAALCCLMDLVISVDTSVAHLAGALGRPVWVLLSWSADWRWMLDRDDSPWYPSMRLFRQQARGDWDGVLRRVARELEARFG